ncbi:MAG: superoxide dismutase [Flavobacterium sp.]|nr:MAG: superoxide dismutase [Flavobacterium sp.]
MKKTVYFISSLVLAISLQSCNDKKLQEVEVPLPEKEVTNAQMGNPADVMADEGTFKMIPLPYAYDALAPYIDAKTMEIHFSKHHLGYTNNLNKAIAGTALEKLTIEEILTKLDLENKAVRNNAGGYYNHNFFWTVMGPNGGGEPTGALAEAIKKDFGSFADFKTQFSDVATKQFGSGWAWLLVDKAGKLSVASTSNQDNPLMPNIGVTGTPVLALDVWEHAYYLNYQNKRADYIDAFFNVINWKEVAKKFDTAKPKTVAVQ